MPGNRGGGGGGGEDGGGGCAGRGDDDDDADADDAVSPHISKVLGWSVRCSSAAWNDF